MVLGTGCISLLACDHGGIVPWKRFYFQLIFLYEKKVWVFEHSRKSEPPSQGMFTQSFKMLTSSEILIYLGT